MYINKKENMFVIYSVKGKALCAFRSLAVASICLRYLKGCAMSTTEAQEAIINLSRWRFNGEEINSIPDEDETDKPIEES